MPQIPIAWAASARASGTFRLAGNQSSGCLPLRAQLAPDVTSTQRAALPRWLMG